MKICNKCKKKQSIKYFKSNNKIFKTCFGCREQNKLNVSIYNKMYREKDLDIAEQTFIYAKKGTDDY